MALIAMAVYDTVENKRSDYTRRTLQSLLKSVDLHRSQPHRLFIINNASCEETTQFLHKFEYDCIELHHLNVTIIHSNVNLGTAGAINLAWKHRLPGENAIKMDNDVEFHYKNWIGLMEEAISRDPKLGIIGLKRNDCWENVNHPNSFYKSELIQLPHNPGQHFIAVEKVNHVMGTCQMFSSALLDKIGYLYQPKLYGFDDSLAAVRCHVAGFYNAFLCNVYMDHIDAGDTPYQKWKETHASEQWKEYHELINGYRNGTKSIYYNPFINESKIN